MSFFSKIFGKKKTEPQAIVQDSPEVKSLFEFEQRMDTLLAQDRFIARSDFAPICRDFAPLHDTFCKLQSTGMLPHFCQTVAIKVGSVSVIFHKSVCRQPELIKIFI